ncbi:unnamed protein product, partial [Ectocarpus sp. 12 AP-2014]
KHPSPRPPGSFFAVPFSPTPAAVAEGADRSPSAAGVGVSLSLPVAVQDSGVMPLVGYRGWPRLPAAPFSGLLLHSALMSDRPRKCAGIDPPRAADVRPPAAASSPVPDDAVIVVLLLLPLRVALSSRACLCTAAIRAVSPFALPAIDEPAAATAAAAAAATRCWWCCPRSSSRRTSPTPSSPLFLPVPPEDRVDPMMERAIRADMMALAPAERVTRSWLLRWLPESS